MSKLILCEGKTDAILLSYYLERTCNWVHQKSPNKHNFKVDGTKGESAYWYQKKDEDLLICGIGGREKYNSFFNEKILRMIVDANEFSKVAVVVDRDDRNEQTIIDSLRVAFDPIFTVIKNDNWVKNYYENSFKEKKPIDFLLAIIPKDKEGALETILLDSISENEYDKKIVKQSISFVDGIQPIASNYLDKKRLKIKAYLGVTWAVQYPEKIFSFIDEQIRSVKWEKSKLLSECFKELMKI